MLANVAGNKYTVIIFILVLKEGYNIAGHYGEVVFTLVLMKGYNVAGHQGEVVFILVLKEGYNVLGHPGVVEVHVAPWHREEGQVTGLVQRLQA